VPLTEVRAFQESFLKMMRANHQTDVLDVLANGVIDDKLTAIIEQVASDVAGQFKVSK
jgi:F-type H+-transporting ATPase subunit alpha